MNESLEDTLEKMIKRDKDDSSRSCAPLTKADDAILVDTSEKDVEAVLRSIMELIDEDMR